LQAIQNSCATDTCRPRIDESVAIIDEALQQVRELSLELRPSLLDELGLVAALRWYAARYASRSGISAAVTCNSEINGVPHEVGTACFRIAQEALTNSARHSKATKATVRVERRNRELRLIIQENGVGFDAQLFLNGMASSALGLRGMQERALAVSGRIQINSQFGKGTEVMVVVPLN
jgi:signal transduction histidine kinase